jgi:hypothetical protein
VFGGIRLYRGLWVDFEWRRAEYALNSGQESLMATTGPRLVYRMVVAGVGLGGRLGVQGIECDEKQEQKEHDCSSLDLSPGVEASFLRTERFLLGASLEFAIYRERTRDWNYPPRPFGDWELTMTPVLQLMAGFVL